MRTQTNFHKDFPSELIFHLVENQDVLGNLHYPPKIYDPSNYHQQRSESIIHYPQEFII
jgi:hypothetical protein